MKLTRRQLKLLSMLDQMHTHGLRWSFRISPCGDHVRVDLDFPESLTDYRYYKWRDIITEAVELQNDLDIEAEANDIDNPVYPEDLAYEGWP